MIIMMMMMLLTVPLALRIKKLILRDKRHSNLDRNPTSPIKGVHQQNFGPLASKNVSLRETFPFNPQSAYRSQSSIHLDDIIKIVRSELPASFSIDMLMKVITQYAWCSAMFWLEIGQVVVASAWHRLLEKLQRSRLPPSLTSFVLQVHVPLCHPHPHPHPHQMPKHPCRHLIDCDFSVSVPLIQVQVPYPRNAKWYTSPRHLEETSCSPATSDVFPFPLGWNQPSGPWFLAKQFWSLSTLFAIHTLRIAVLGITLC